jgi:S-adenosylmethionine decarboxylase
MIDLAPTIYRQRLIIEGKRKQEITGEDVEKYLTQLCNALKMKKLTDPVTSKSEKYGWAGWMHWETSGVHFYAWNLPSPFFSVDIYTCKHFEVNDAVSFTKEYFGATDLVYKSV